MFIEETFISFSLGNVELLVFLGQQSRDADSSRKYQPGIQESWAQEMWIWGSLVCIWFRRWGNTGLLGKSSEMVTGQRSRPKPNQHE